MKRVGFLTNLVQVGLVIGLWTGIGMTQLFGLVAAYAGAVVGTLIAGGSLAWDAHKAWQEHHS